MPTELKLFIRYEKSESTIPMHYRVATVHIFEVTITTVIPDTSTIKSLFMETVMFQTKTDQY